MGRVLFARPTRVIDGKTWTGEWHEVQDEQHANSAMAGQPHETREFVIADLARELYEALDALAISEGVPQSLLAQVNGACQRYELEVGN